MSALEWAFVVGIIAAVILARRLPYSGIAWGGRNSKHPGWWLIKSETRYVRPLRSQEPSHDG